MWQFAELRSAGPIFHKICRLENSANPQIHIFLLTNIGLLRRSLNILFVIRVLLWRQVDNTVNLCYVCGENPPVRFDLNAPILLENKLARVLDVVHRPIL